MNNIVTSDLAEFGNRELDEVVKLIKAEKECGFPEDFHNEDVTIFFNKNSGCVFFSNSDCQVCMCDEDGDLFSWYYTPYEGEEGFIFDLADRYYELHADDRKYVKEIRDKFYPDVVLKRKK
jgi:hypothetical protein